MTTETYQTAFGLQVSQAQNTLLASPLTRPVFDAPRQTAEGEARRSARLAPARAKTNEETPEQN